MRAPRLVNHGRNEKSGNQGAIGVGSDYFRLDNFFGDDDHAARGARAIHRDAKIAPHVRVAITVGALHLNDGDVGFQRANGDELFFVHAAK